MNDQTLSIPIVIHVGPSNFKTKFVKFEAQKQQGYFIKEVVIPEYIDKNNWCNNFPYPDIFKVDAFIYSNPGGEYNEIGITVTRTDSICTEWGMDLQFECVILYTRANDLVPCEVKCRNEHVLVLGIVRNISHHYINFLETIQNIKHVFDTKFCFTTNNNTDNTIELLNNITCNDDNIIFQCCKNIEYDLHSRTSTLAKIRNINFRFAKESFKDHKFDLILIFDTDLNVSIPKHVIHDFDKGCPNKHWDLITSNTVCSMDEYYYDMFALRLMEQPDNIDEVYPLFNRYYGISPKWVEPNYNFHNWIQVRSAFGGFCFINNNNCLLDFETLYDENINYKTCEHLSFCKQFKYVYINPYFKYNNDLNWELSNYIIDIY